MNEEEQTMGREVDEASLTNEEKAEMRLFLPKAHTVMIEFAGKPYRLSSLDLTHGFFTRINAASDTADDNVKNEALINAFAFLLTKITGLPREKVLDYISWPVAEMLSKAIARLKEKAAQASLGPLGEPLN